MTSNWKITEAFGTPAEIERLMDEAIGLAGVTGSKGATANQNSWDGEKTTVTASVTVERVGA